MKKTHVSLVVLALFSLTVWADETSTSRWTESETTFHESPFTTGVDVQFVPVRLPNYGWNGDGSTTTRSGQGVHLAIEWVPLDRQYGKLGFGLGSGFYNLRDSKIHGSSIGMIPFEGFISYRFDYVPYQLLVPFLKTGLDLSLVSQRGMVTVPGIQSYWGYDYGAGVELSLSSLDRRTSRMLDASLGINAVYINVEYVQSVFLARARRPDLSREEWRLGLRFEI